MSDRSKPQQCPLHQHSGRNSNITCWYKRRYSKTPPALFCFLKFESSQPLPYPSYCLLTSLTSMLVILQLKKKKKKTAWSDREFHDLISMTSPRLLVLLKVKRTWFALKFPLSNWSLFLLCSLHSKNEDQGTQSHHFMANRWGNNGNSDRLYFLWLQNHCRLWPAAMKLKDTCSLEEKLWQT